MAWTNMRLKLLGSLHGTGTLSAGDDAHALGEVSYELDGYEQRGTVSANGRIEGDAAALTAAYEAGHVRLDMADGTSLALKLSDPDGEALGDVEVQGRMPRFGDAGQAAA